MKTALSGGLLSTVQAVGNNFDWDVAVVPKGPGRRAVHFSADMWCMWKDTKAPDATWALLDFFESEDFWKINIPASAQEPPRKSLMPLWAELTKKRIPEVASKNLQAFADAKTNNYGYREPLFRYHAEAIPLYHPAYVRAIANNEAPVADTFRVVATQVSDLMRQLDAGR
jgi:ABC-type glycerol-3-phosphate transport system substrate-binding protein